MTTTVTRYINTGAAAGGDGTTRALSGGNHAYQSIDAAQAAEAKDISLGTGTDEIFLFRCAGGADDSNFDFSASWVCDASGYIIIEPDDGQEHPGVFDGSIYRATFSNSVGCWRIPAGLGKIIIRGIQWRPGTSSSINRRWIRVSGGTSFSNGLIVENCMCDGGNLTGASGHSVVFGNASNLAVVVRNNLIKDFIGTTAFALVEPAGTTGSEWRTYNNTFKDNGCAVGGPTSGNHIVKNCLFDGNTDDGDGAGTLSGSNNASTNATSVGTSPRVNQTFTFADTSYRLASTDAGALGFGVDLSGDTDAPVTTDWEGDARDPSTPDIGWDEAPATDQFTEHLIRVYV